MSISVIDWVLKSSPATGGDRLVLLAIANHANSDGEAYPGVSTIAEKAAISERGTRKALRRLEAKGWLVTQPGKGRGNTSLYRIVMPKTGEIDDVKPEPEDSVSSSPFTIKPELRDIKPELRDTKTGTPVPPNRQLTVREPSEIYFDQFWNLVPRKVGKGQARRALKAALKKTDPQTILSKMAEYASQRAGQDPRYTAHPATWLNGERWEDDAPAPQLRVVSSREAINIEKKRRVREAAERIADGFDQGNRTHSQQFLPSVGRS